MRSRYKTTRGKNLATNNIIGLEYGREALSSFIPKLVILKQSDKEFVRV
jgi:hypothetical protein